MNTVESEPKRAIVQ